MLCYIWNNDRLTFCLCSTRTRAEPTMDSRGKWNSRVCRRLSSRCRCLLQMAPKETGPAGTVSLTVIPINMQTV